MRILLWASCVAFASAAEEFCTLHDAKVAAHLGEALLQTGHVRDASALGEGPVQRSTQESPKDARLSALRVEDGTDDEQLDSDLLTEAGYGAEGYQGSPNCVPSEVEAEHRRVALFAVSRKRAPVGESAPLDAAGFKVTTSLCCPHEMEQFFSRILHSQGQDVCSKSHFQGLMHWFTCVPDMDFQYVLDVIANGNPCKYWAPKGQPCPKLSAECEGQHCASPKSMTSEKPQEATTITTTTTTTTTTNACEGDVELVFSNATKSHNNVGGKGPDSGDEYLRLTNLGNYQGKSFDLLVSSTSSKYTTPEGYAQYNGVYGYFGYLTMATGSEFNLKFSFVESGTNTPMTLSKFYFTFFDLDTGDVTDSGAGAAEEVSATGYEKYFVGPDNELSIQTNDQGVNSFRATKYGTGADNPKDPLNMTQQQQNRAVTFQFLDKSEFEATYNVSAGASVGRDIYFAGKSQLALNPCFGEAPFSTITMGDEAIRHVPVSFEQLISLGALEH